MELNARLRAFSAVARRGSFSRAAEELYVSQPAVSKQVAQLELELGHRLLARTPHGAELTEHGKLLADYVLRAEALLANARLAIESGGNPAVGSLTLAASGTPGLYLLPRLLARFHESYPGVEIVYDMSESAHALELVRAHRAEIGIVGTFVLPPELDGELLREDAIVLVGPPSLGGRRWRLRELQELTWVTRERGSATRAASEAAALQLGLSIRRRLELVSWESIKLAVAGGAGVAAVSRIAIDVELKAGTLVILDAPWWRASRQMAVVYARDVPLTPPAERFLELVRETRAAWST
jgi:LysR family transcriptional regulator, transcriptional activator of the cysJI operon